MDFTENYSLFDEDYIKGKRNILITQQNKSGQYYYMAIYKPDIHKLLLIQVKYQIDYKSIQEKEKYKDTGEDTLKNFQKAFHDYSTKEVYLLYISSEEYNFERKKTVKSILDKYKINCLFYSVTKGIYTFDFEKKIIDLKLEDSFMILPKIKNYQSQEIKIDKIEKKIILKENRQILLGKKLKKEYDTDKIYQTLKEYISSQKIGFLMGKINEINIVPDDIKLVIDKEKEYVILFSLKDEDDSLLDLEKPIGLTYTKGKDEFYIEITQTEINYFSNFNDLFKKFTSICYYGLGEKIIS